MRRIILWLFPFFLIGVLLNDDKNIFIICAVVTALFFTVIIRRYYYIGVFIVVFVLGGILAASITAKEFDGKYSYLSSIKTYEGYIIDKSENSYTIKNYASNYKIILYYYQKTDAKPGDYIIFNGKLSDRPVFKRSIMNSNGINAYVSCSTSNIKIENRSSFYMLPVKLKYKIIDGLISIQPEGGTFISGLITGYTGQLQENTKVAFMDLGLSHILAVSGFNLGIIYYFVLIAAQKLNSRTKYLLAFTICFVYTAISGFEPSISRAFIMLSLVVISKLTGRFYDNLSGITLTAFIMLIINSYYIYNIGFLLSFSATYGILLFSKEIENSLPSYVKAIREELSTGLSAFIATIPIILWYKGYFSLITIMINLLLSPLISLLTIISFIIVFLYLLITIKLILYPVVFLGILFVKLVSFANTVNIMIYPGNPGFLFITLYYFSVFYYFEFIKLKCILKYRKALLGTCITAISLLLLYHSPLLKIHFINVGQGESIFVETPQHKGILIDTGPKRQDYSALKSVVLPYIRRLGYNSIDLLILTHFHIDHAGDYQYFLEHFKVKKAVAFKSPIGSKYKFDELKAGDEIIDGSVKINILAPSGNITLEDNDQNETCLVMDFHYKAFSILLTGDAEKVVLDHLAGIYDVYNVSHHGSVKSFSTEMIDNSKIGTAVISVGKNNFGHPSPLVIDYLISHYIPVYRTDKDGSVTIVSNGENYRILYQ